MFLKERIKLLQDQGAKEQKVKDERREVDLKCGKLLNQISSIGYKIGEVKAELCNVQDEVEKQEIEKIRKTLR